MIDLRLLAWTSPNCPTGAFAYSHGLEQAVEDGDVTNADELVEFIEAVLTRGGGWVDAVMFAATYRADPERLDEIADLAAAFRGSAETSLESLQQGRSLLSVLRAAWPHPALDAFAERRGREPIAQPVAMALACAAHEIKLPDGLVAQLYATASSLVSAGVRLVPLGQTQGQIAMAQLMPVIQQVAALAYTAKPDEIGTNVVRIELASMRHETQTTRLFRS
ncbi:urease accessory protein UreF [Roseiterribacter gracilis]|uniref:Urease accessory protein UreF n=1 Tax=Roseiterribacter gracilis TaxID=2812848 RepID=A0A8S8X7N6_9PROT|nr:urease accessory protein UreF [Rhodospirillales bacterium TMPK1]